MIQHALGENAAGGVVRAENENVGGHRGPSVPKTPAQDTEWVYERDHPRSVGVPRYRDHRNSDRGGAEDLLVVARQGLAERALVNHGSR